MKVVRQCVDLALFSIFALDALLDFVQSIRNQNHFRVALAVFVVVVVLTAVVSLFSLLLQRRQLVCNHFPFGLSLHLSPERPDLLRGFIFWWLLFLYFHCKHSWLVGKFGLLLRLLWLQILTQELVLDTACSWIQRRLLSEGLLFFFDDVELLAV